MSDPIRPTSVAQAQADLLVQAMHQVDSSGVNQVLTQIGDDTAAAEVMMALAVELALWTAARIGTLRIGGLDWTNLAGPYRHTGGAEALANTVVSYSLIGDREGCQVAVKQAIQGSQMATFAALLMLVEGVSFVRAQEGTV